MIDLKQFIQGYIGVKLTSQVPSRFFNICSANDILIYDIKYTDGVYYFKTPKSQYRRLKPILRKTASNAKIIQKYGLGFLMHKYRKHNCFACGFLLSVFMIYIMSLFLWSINIDGNYRITDDMIIDVLNAAGINTGMLTAKINEEQIEKLIRSSFYDITWVSVESVGTQINIYLKETSEDYIPQVTYTECDITATCSGVIDYIITRNGTPQKSVGDAVSRGEVIVSGIINIYDDNEVITQTQKVAADADIYIRTEYIYEDSIDEEYIYRLYTGSMRRYFYINIFNYHICPLSKNPFAKSDTTVYDYRMKISDALILPISFGIKEITEYIEEGAFYTKQEAFYILEEHLNYYIDELSEKDVQIISKDVKMGKYLNEYTYTGTINVIAPAYEKTAITQTTDTDIGVSDEYN